MFVVSVKSAFIKKIALFVLVAIFAVIGGIVSVSDNKTATVGNFTDVPLKAESHNDRKAFFTSFGWEISDEPVEVKETVIPEEFDETYAQYNELQKNQGFNLEKYKNTRVKAWSYEILNYPGYESSNGTIRGNLLVCDGRIIGGDICSVELGGFMHGFCKEKEITEDSPSLPREEVYQP
mgnify:CR=1 FL=1